MATAGTTGLLGNTELNPSGSVAGVVAALGPQAMAAQAQYGVPADVLLAITSSEDPTVDVPGWYFGIKCHPGVDCENLSTSEYGSGGTYNTNAGFAVYPDYASGVQDFLSTIATYSTDPLKDVQNPSAFLADLERAGYATSPDWPALIQSRIQQIDALGVQGSGNAQLAQGAAGNVTLGYGSSGGGGVLGDIGGSIISALQSAYGQPFERVGIFLLGLVVVIGGLLVFTGGRGSSTVVNVGKRAGAAAVAA